MSSFWHSSVSECVNLFLLGQTFLPSFLPCGERNNWAPVKFFLCGIIHIFVCGQWLNRPSNYFFLLGRFCLMHLSLLLPAHLSLLPTYFYFYLPIYLFFYLYISSSTYLSISSSIFTSLLLPTYLSLLPTYLSLLPTYLSLLLTYLSLLPIYLSLLPTYLFFYIPTYLFYLLIL